MLTSGPQTENHQNVSEPYTLHGSGVGNLIFDLVGQSIILRQKTRFVHSGVQDLIHECMISFPGDREGKTCMTIRQKDFFIIWVTQKHEV